MKKFYILLLLLTVATGYGQIITIPDANFKAKLLAASSTYHVAMNTSGNWFKIDSNNDGQIQVSEALLVRKLYLDNSGIASMQGIGSFLNLEYLECANNEIVTLDVTGLTLLKDVECYANETMTAVTVAGCTSLEKFDCSISLVSSLDLTGLPNLNYLWCSGANLSSLNLTQLPSLETCYVFNNQLTSLDFSGNPNLKYVICSDNLLTSLTVSDKMHLEEFGCHFNQLTSLNLSNLPALNMLNAIFNNLATVNITGVPNLRTISLGNNQLTSLNNENFPGLQALSCANNQLTELDFSSNPVFIALVCANNNLQYINVKNGLEMGNPPNSSGDMDWSGNPLAFVCVDESEAAFIENVLLLNGLDGVNLNTYCSFTPGGSYNTITGSVSLDNEVDGCDSGDGLGSFVRLRLVDGTNTSYAYTNNTGQYSFYTGQGTFVVYPDFENLSYFNIAPPVSLYNFPTPGGTVNTQDYCLTPNGSHPDVEIAVVPMGQPRPGFNVTYHITIRNKGNQSLDGNVSFVYNADQLNFVSASVVPDVQVAGNLNWNYSGLLPFETREIIVVLQVHTPMDTPPVNNGDQINLSAVINPVSGDETPLDNVFVLNQIVVGSFDPNDKICIQGNVVSPEKIGDYLHYVINFENTGTAAAEFIVIKDEIDLSKFEISTLQVLSASHPMEARIIGGRVEFIFDDVQLGPNEHGYVTFKIKTKSSLTVGATVTNNAEIFFDYNFPIITNTASTTFQVLGIPESVLNNAITIYPNPADNIMNVKSTEEITSVQIYDAAGRIITTKLANENQIAIDASTFGNGIYYLKVTTLKGTSIEKLIIK